LCGVLFVRSSKRERGMSSELPIRVKVEIPGNKPFLMVAHTSIRHELDPSSLRQTVLESLEMAKHAARKAVP
jgi:hypothetical protein